MKIATYITHPQHEGYKLLLQSCPELITLPRVEKSLGKGILDKVKAMHDFCATLPTDEIVAFVDGYDVIILDSPESIEQRFHILNADIVVNAEKALWTPDLEALRSQYDTEPMHVGTWLFLNSGVYIGYAGKVRDMLAIMLYMFEKKTETADDQAAMHLLYLASRLRIKLDTSCHLTQCYSFIGDIDFVYEPHKVINNITGTQPAFIHGNGKTDMRMVEACLRTSFDYMVANWEDTEAFHDKTNKAFAALIDNPLSATMKSLCNLRNYVEQNAYGFGERSFMVLWYILMEQLPMASKCLEVGVFRGQSIAALNMCAVLLGKQTEITGVSLFEKGGNIADWDFSQQDTFDLHKEFSLPTGNLRLIKGDSQDLAVIEQANDEYDLVYIDGDHSYEGAFADLENYAPMLKSGGFLVVDDCCTDLQIPFGMFPGIASVTEALNDYLRLWGYELLFSVVHIKVFRKL